MLKGIPPLLTADVLHALLLMGHGDDIAVVDAYFPAATLARRSNASLVQLPGTTTTEILHAVLQLMPLDDFDEHASWTMEVVGDSTHAPQPVLEFRDCLLAAGELAPATLERFAFYECTSKASLIIQSGDRRSYANILLRKGVLQDTGTAIKNR
jgi:L-fucose mutarotase